MSYPVALPPPARAVGTYAMAVRSGSPLYVSGHGAFEDGKPIHAGRLGKSLTTEEDARAAEAVMLGLLATDLLVRVLGESRGRPARSAIGVAALPLGFAVEIEAIVEIKAQGG